MALPKSALLPIAVLGASAVIVTGIVASLSAQQGYETPNVPGLAAKLDNEYKVFLATTDFGKQITGQNIEAGRLVAVGGSEQGGAGMACVTCHGAEGAGEAGAGFPRLSGLPAWYMYKQLNDYATGTRPNDIMSGIAKQLTDSEKQSVSSYYAVVNAPYPPVQEAVDLKRLQYGGQLAVVGSVEKGIPACTNCHGGQGFGVPPSVPYLSGQHLPYMKLQLQLWKDGVRNNDPLNVMHAIATKMTKEDIDAVSQYYARVRPLELQGATTRAVPPASAR